MSTPQANPTPMRISSNIQKALDQDSNHPLQDYAIIFEQSVAWGDMDAFHHVNNVRYYDYAQSARIHYMQQFAMFDEQVSTRLAASSCQYLSPVIFPDTLYIGTRIKKLGNTSVTHEYAYFSVMQNCIVATGESVLVRFNNDEKTKRPFSKSEREQILSMEKGVVEQ